MATLRKFFAGCLTPKGSPRCVTALYILFGTLWILLSDQVVSWRVADQANFAVVQTAKGLVYIGVTAYLVHWLSLRTVAHAAHRAAQQELESTRKLFERVLASLGEAVIVVDPDSRTVLQCNPAAEQVFGYRESELVGQGTEILHTNEESYRRFSDISEPVLQEKGIFRTEYPMKRKDGTVIHTEVSVNTLEEDLGWRHGVVSVIRDISARKKAEKNSRDQFARLRQLVERLPDAVFIKDCEHRYVLINAAAAAMIGVEPDRARGRTDLEILPPHAGEVALQRDRQALECGGVTTYEELTAARDGTVHYLLTSKGALYDSAGHPDGLFGISRDITESVRLRDALEERVKELRALFETTHCLAQVEQPLEMRLERLVDCIPPGWQHPENTGVRLTFEDLTLASPNFRETEWMQSSPIRRFDVVIGHLEVALLEAPTEPEAPTFLEEERALLDNIARAVGEAAERKRLEEQYQQAQKLESIGRLAGGVAHDFNNMLSVILGHCDMALTNLQDGATHRFEFEQIMKAGRRAADLTQRLLAFSRQEIARPVSLDLNREIESLASMLKRMVTEDIELDLNLGTAPVTVRMDPGQAQQILANLVVNARDAIEGAGSITITTSRRTLDAAACATLEECAPGDYVVLTVRDTGSGMDSATQTKVFEPFFTTKPEGKGTGLGLAMVYGIVRQNRGAVQLQSAPGQGSTFSIYLPYDAHYTAEKAPAEPITVQKRGTETLLLVEDEEQILRLNARTIENMGYTVLTASTPAAALEQIETREEPIDLLITDVVMPGMNGRELYEAIARHQPGVKCLFTSGYTADVIAERGILKENVHFLQKPFSRMALGVRIREILES